MRLSAHHHTRKRIPQPRVNGAGKGTAPTDPISIPHWLRQEPPVYSLQPQSVLLAPAERPVNFALALHTFRWGKAFDGEFFW